MGNSTEFNFLYMAIFVLFGSAIVALGIHDLNNYYRRYSRPMTDQEAEEMVWDLQGRLDWDAVARRRQEEHLRANVTRKEEMDNVKRFLENLVP